MPPNKEKPTFSVQRGHNLLLEVAKNSAGHWSQDSVPRLAAAFSFYAMLSLAPMLIFAIAIAGQFVASTQFQDHLLNQVHNNIGPEASKFVKSLIVTTNAPGKSSIATLISLIVTFFAASNLFVQLTQTFTTIWGITDRKLGIVKGLILTRIYAFVAVLVFGAFLISWIALDTWLQLLQRRTQTFAGWPAVSFVVAVLFLTGVFAISYRALPKGHTKWNDVWLGAFVAAVGVAISKYFLTLYFGYAHIAGAFGPAGALVLIMLWIYYTSQIYFFGAEIVYSYAHMKGSRREMQDNREPTYS